MSSPNEPPSVAPNTAKSHSAAVVSPAIPLKDYLHQPLPALLPPPPAYRPNAAIPAFIRAVAVLVFVVGGLTSAGTAWFFQRFIYPRLVLKVGIITRLTSGHLASYDNLLCKLRDLVAGPGYSLLAPNASSEASEAGGEEERQTGAAAPAAEGLGAGKAAEAVAEGASSGGKEGGEKAGDIDDSATKADDAPPPPQILAPLQCSIQALSTAIAASHPSPPSPSTPATSLYAATPSSTSAPPPSRPSEGLSQSLSALSEYLVTQTYASTSPAYRSYGLVASGSVPGSVGAEKKSLPEAISNFKIEVRAVKGALLNRRNFATLAPRGEAASS